MIESSQHANCLVVVWHPLRSERKALLPATNVFRQLSTKQARSQARLPYRGKPPFSQIRRIRLSVILAHPTNSPVDKIGRRRRALPLGCRVGQTKNRSDDCSSRNISGKNNITHDSEIARAALRLFRPPVFIRSSRYSEMSSALLDRT